MVEAIEGEKYSKAIFDACLNESIKMMFMNDWGVFLETQEFRAYFLAKRARQ